MTWILLLIAIALVAYQQHRNHQALLERLEEINTDVDAIVKARRELADFIRRRVTERVAEFKTGGGRERLRARLEARRAVKSSPEGEAVQGNAGKE